MAVSQYSTYAAWQYLRHRLADGSLSPQHQRFFNTHIREAEPGSSTFYTRALTDQGRRAAEDQLLAWDAEHGYSTFATSIQTVGTGLLDLLEADRRTGSQLVRMADVPADSQFPDHHELRGHGRMLVWSGQDSGQSLPGGAEHYGPQGELDLQAVVLSVYEVANIALLTLVLPAGNGLSTRWQQSDGCTVVTFDLTGTVSVNRLLPHRPVASMWQQVLQLSDPPLLEFETRPLRLDDVLAAVLYGQTAVSWLSNWLSGLGQYLSSLARLRAQDSIPAGDH